MDMDTAIAVAENVADEKPLDGGLMELFESLWEQPRHLSSKTGFARYRTKTFLNLIIMFLSSSN